MDQRGLEWIEELATQARGNVHEVSLVDEKAVTAIGEVVPSVMKVRQPSFEPDRRCESRKEYATGSEDSPHFGHRSLELARVLREVEEVFSKKTKETPKQVIETCKARLRAYRSL